MSEKETSSHDAAIGPYVRDGAPIGDDSKRCDRCEKTHPVEWSFGHECDLCPDCAVDGLRSEVSRLEAAVQEQAALVGKDIDAHDKLVMEKRGLEVDNDRLTAKCARMAGALRIIEDGLNGPLPGKDLFDTIRWLGAEDPRKIARAALDDEPPIAVVRVQWCLHCGVLVDEWASRCWKCDSFAGVRESGPCDIVKFMDAIIVPTDEQRPAADLPEQGE